MSAPTAAAGGRADRLEPLLDEKGLDGLLVTELINVRYLCGFTGTNGVCLVGKGLRCFLTDFRYVERAEQEVGEGWERPVVERELLPHVFERAKGKLGFEDAHVSVRQLEQLQEKAPAGTELVAAGDLVEDLRRVKDEGEIETIAAAAELADQVFEWTTARGLAGRSEREVARAAEARIRELGAEPSFPVILAAGPNGAQPHAEPGERVIGSGELVVFDMGAQIDGYCSDDTRTFASGDPGEEAREVYELVRSAQAAALDAVRAGAGGVQIDAVARELIAEGGHGERFGHGLGHGVGLEVHERPTLSVRSEDELAAGNVVTVEPGVYVPGEFGVRIEDLVVVTEDGHRNLSGRPKGLEIVD
ncbi:MAG: M24 family metallopeptidase [Solirubrobacterales bacterium]